MNILTKERILYWTWIGIGVSALYGATWLFATAAHHFRGAS